VVRPPQVLLGREDVQPHSACATIRKSSTTSEKDQKLFSLRVTPLLMNVRLRNASPGQASPGEKPANSRKVRVRTSVAAAKAESGLGKLQPPVCHPLSLPRELEYSSVEQ